MKHAHFIGICGTAMAPLAKALKDLGWRVTGSDKGIFPPMSDYLRAHRIEFYVGFHPERIGAPDLAVVGNFIGPSNPEFIAVQKRGLPYRAYPEVLAESLIKPESVVVAGSYGKTFTTALLAWIWETAGLHPSYMAAGILNNFPGGVRITDSKWSIVEGDEYPSSRWKPVPKFDFYNPKYLLLTGAAWDHADVYPSEEEYVSVFKKLVRSLPHDGMVAAAIQRPNIHALLDDTDAVVLHYNRIGEGKAEWSLEIVERDAHGTVLRFHGLDGEKIGPCTCAVLGDQNLDHFAGAVGLARYCGISAESVARALETFQGVRRRMEIRGVEHGITVIDDFAHSPMKASSTLQGIRCHFPHAKVIVIFEPNVGNRVISSKPLYRHAFHDANAVIIPRLTAAKTSKGEEERMNGETLAQVIRDGNLPNPSYSRRGQPSVSPLRRGSGRGSWEVIYEPNDDALISRITKNARPGDVIAFLGSHGFRGMIESTLASLA